MLDLWYEVCVVMYVCIENNELSWVVQEQFAGRLAGFKQAGYLQMSKP
jgi:hypothetical protein